MVDVGEAATQDPLQYIDSDAWLLRASTSWTRSYIEIYDASSSNWHAVQRSSSADMLATMECPHYYDPELNKPVTLGYIEKSGILYSTYYADTATRKLQAVQAYLGGYILFDDIGDIKYYFSNPTDPNARAVLIFTHEDPG